MYSTSLIIKEMQMKINDFHLTSVRITIIKKTSDKGGEDVDQREPSYTLGGNVR